MDITPTTLILIGVVCVVLGFMASALLNTLRDDVDPPAEGVDQAPPGGRKNRYTPVVRLWRERGAGTMVVEIDGRSFTAPEALDATQRERLERAARELRAWLGMGLSGADYAPPVTSPGPVETYAPPPAAQPAQPYKAAPAAPPISPAVPGKVDEPKAPANRSIVMQIDDVLQEMIEGTPLSQRGVHLIEDPRRGVLVQVGLDFYEGIEAVPDPDIKNTIRTAVQTWESTQ